MATPPLGRFRSRLSLQLPVDVEDGAGGMSRTWQFVADVWGSIEPLAAQQRFMAQRMEQSVTHVIYLRWREDICLGWRLLFGSRTFLVHACYDPTTQKRHLVCQCEEIV